MNPEAIKRITAWRRGGTAAPFSVELSPTLRCNLRCRFCWQQGVDHIDHSTELPDEFYPRIVREGAELGVVEWRIIGGGESLCRPNVTHELIRRIKDYGMYGYLCTNGSLFTEQTIKETVACGWDHVKISFESPVPETQDFLAGHQGAFEKITRNLGLFAQYKKKLGRQKPFMEIGMVLTNQNYQQLSEMLKLAKSYNVQAVFAEPVTVYTELGAQLKLGSEQQESLRESAEQALAVAKRYAIQTNFSDFLQESRLVTETGSMHKVLLDYEQAAEPFLHAACYEPWYRIGIRVDGIVCPCGFYDVESNESIREKSLAEVWFGDYFQKRRTQILQGKLPAHCARCCTTLVVENQRIRQHLLAVTNDKF